MRVLIPAVERDGYADLTVLLTSLRVYNPAVHVTVAYKGARPKLFGADFIEQPEDCAHFGDACRFLLQTKHTKNDEALCFLNDDTVVMPDTLEMAALDVQALTQQGQKIGMLGFRSNFVAGYQNVRVMHPGDNQLYMLKFPSESKILRVSQVFGVGFVTMRHALQDISLDWTRLHWYSDDLLSYDLTQKGYGHFVSRAYIHHIGSRSGGQERWAQWDQEGKDWIIKNRPDYATVRGWSAPVTSTIPLVDVSSSTATDPR
jgi:hypothetical protein